MVVYYDDEGNIRRAEYFVSEPTATEGLEEEGLSWVEVTEEELGGSIMQHTIDFDDGGKYTLERIPISYPPLPEIDPDGVDSDEEEVTDTRQMQIDQLTTLMNILLTGEK